MPKIKSKKIVVKRFKITKNGKVLHRVQGARHLRRNKSKSRQNRQDKMAEVTTIKFKNVVKHFS
jgi:ribosomal protein L35